MRVSDDEQGINKLAILGGDMEKYWEEIWSDWMLANDLL